MNRLHSNSLRLGFLASHNATDMRAIIGAIESGDLIANAEVVISNNSKAPALIFAQEHGIPAYHISQATHSSKENVDIAIRDTLQDHNVNLVILSGYMQLVLGKTLAAFKNGNQIINVHPSLLPKFAGLYGDNVHKSVLETGEKVTGITLHTIEKEYDKGTILFQSKVPVYKKDTVESLRERVQEEEKRSFITLLKQIQSGKSIMITS